jgi:hypothetical protein
VLLDPFCGSGAMSAAGFQHVLQVMGMDKERRYLKMAVKRVVVFPSIRSHDLPRRPIRPLPVRLHDRDLTRRHRRPEEVFEFLGREADDPAETIFRRFRARESGNSRVICGQSPFGAVDAGPAGSIGYSLPCIGLVVA